MTQIHNIVAALDAVATENPMKSAIDSAGFVGGLHQGTDANRGADRPFGLITAERAGGVENSSGVSLVEYLVTLQIVVDEDANVTGEILDAFHRYWDRLAGLPLIDDDDDIPANFVLIHPEGSEQGEDERQQEGRDIMLGVTTWTLKLAEHQPELET